MSKRNLSKDALAIIAERFKILSEPVRLQILHALQDGPLTVNELTDIVGSSQPNVSKHLKMLTFAGFLHRTQEGNSVIYSIADKSIFSLCEMVCDSIEAKMKSEAEIFAS